MLTLKSKNEKGFSVITDDAEISKQLFQKLLECVTEMGVEFGIKTVSIQKSRAKPNAKPVGRQKNVFKEPTKEQIKKLDFLLNQGEYLYKNLNESVGLSLNGFRTWLCRNDKYLLRIAENKKNNRLKVEVSIIEKVDGLS